MLGYFGGFQLDLYNIFNKHFFAFYGKSWRYIKNFIEALYSVTTVSFYVKSAKNIIFNLIDQL